MNLEEEDLKKSKSPKKEKQNKKIIKFTNKKKIIEKNQKELKLQELTVKNDFETIEKDQSKAPIIKKAINKRKYLRKIPKETSKEAKESPNNEKKRKTPKFDQVLIKKRKTSKSSKEATEKNELTDYERKENTFLTIIPKIKTIFSEICKKKVRNLQGEKITKKKQQKSQELFIQSENSSPIRKIEKENKIKNKEEKIKIDQPIMNEIKQTIDEKSASSENDLTSPKKLQQEIIPQELSTIYLKKDQSLQKNIELESKKELQINFIMETEQTSIKQKNIDELQIPDNHLEETTKSDQLKIVEHKISSEEKQKSEAEIKHDSSNQKTQTSIEEKQKVELISINQENAIKSKIDVSEIPNKGKNIDEKSISTPEKINESSIFEDLEMPIFYNFFENEDQEKILPKNLWRIPANCLNGRLIKILSKMEDKIKIKSSYLRKKQQKNTKNLCLLSDGSSFNIEEDMTLVLQEPAFYPIDSDEKFRTIFDEKALEHFPEGFDNLSFSFSDNKNVPKSVKKIIYWPVLVMQNYCKKEASEFVVANPNGISDDFYLNLECSNKKNSVESTINVTSIKKKSEEIQKIGFK